MRSGDSVTENQISCITRSRLTVGSLFLNKLHKIWFLSIQNNIILCSVPIYENCYTQKQKDRLVYFIIFYLQKKIGMFNQGKKSTTIERGNKLFVIMLAIVPDKRQDKCDV